VGARPAAGDLFDRGQNLRLVEITVDEELEEGFDRRYRDP
jgi:hypothetical protein